MVTYDDVAAAHERIKSQAHRTPVMTSRQVDALAGASVFFKCENLQRMGAFKFRGAYNALSLLSSGRTAARRARFFLGQPCAGGGARRDSFSASKTTIVMPEDAPKVKLEATRGLRRPRS